MDVLRPDGTLERLQCPKQGIIPHDKLHYAVEHTVNARGFLRRVRDGESAGFRMAPDSGSDDVQPGDAIVQPGDVFALAFSPPVASITTSVGGCWRSCSCGPVMASGVRFTRSVRPSSRLSARQTQAPSAPAQLPMLLRNRCAEHTRLHRRPS